MSIEVRTTFKDTHSFTPYSSFHESKIEMHQAALDSMTTCQIASP